MCVRGWLLCLMCHKVKPFGARLDLKRPFPRICGSCKQEHQRFMQCWELKIQVLRPEERQLLHDEQWWEQTSKELLEQWPKQRQLPPCVSN
jgi:hypothetical protein